MTTPSGVCAFGPGFVGCIRLDEQALAAAGSGPKIWFDGELHNLPELRRTLGLESAAALPQVLAMAWRRWGERIGEHLNGVYALVLADAQGALLLRDASALRSLYADTGRPGELWFASALGPLMRRPGARPRLARASLHEYLRLGDIAAPRTIYEDVLAAEPGVPWRWSAQGLRLLAPQSTPAAPQPPDFEAALDELDARLRQALARRLDDAVRPAAFLSGGVDSALLCALAAPQRADLAALTIGFDTAALDESAIARRIAQHLGLRHEVLRFGQAQCLQAFERLARAADQPLADPATPVTVLAFDHCRERFDAVLDGTGADEAVGLMPLRHMRVAVQYAARLPLPLRRALTALLRASPRSAPYARITDFEHPAETMMRWWGFGRAEIEALCGEPVSLAGTRFVRTFERYPRGAHFERYSALYDAMPCERLNQAERASGLAVRFPYADPNVDRHLRQLRTDYRWLPGQPKRILRALLARYVPEPIWDMPKHGLDFPLHAFLAADGHALVRRHLDAARWRERTVLDGGLVARYAARYMAGEAALAFRVWSLVMLGAWLEAHDELA
ncbi:MAG: asparagine synthase-related protein [Rubrivivax sp.]